MNVNSKKRHGIKNYVFIELFFVTSFLSLLIFILNFFGKFTLFNLLLLLTVFFLFVKYLKIDIFHEILKFSIWTALLMGWSLSSTGMDYLVYEFDWNSFGIPINLNNNNLLYANDLLSNQAYPHVWIYKIVSYFINSIYFEIIFLFGFIFQNYFKVKAFDIIYKNTEFIKSKNNHALILLLPLFFYPQISGHYTSLPFFLPAILGYSLSVFNISNFIFNKNTSYEDYLYLFLLVFIHPFWSVFTTLYLLMCFTATKNIKLNNSYPILFLFVISIYLNNFDGISIRELYGSELIDFYKNYIKIHFDWSAHIGFIFENEINNLYQQSLLLIFIFGLVIKGKYLNFSTLENTFYSSFGLISLLIVVGNLFHNSLFNNFLISSNFYRIGSLAWFFIGVYIFKIFGESIYSYLFLFVPLVFYLFSNNEAFSKTIGLLPTFNFSSNYSYLFLVAAVYLLYKNQIKWSFLTSLTGILYFLIFYFIDKIIIENYLIKSLILSFFIFTSFYFMMKKIQINAPLVIFLLVVLFCSATFTVETLFKNLDLEYQTQLSTENINKIKNNTDENSVILVDPNMSYFRKETSRGILIDYSLIPYNLENYQIYKRYKGLFNGKSIKNLKVNEIQLIINNTNVSDVILPEGSIAEKYFIKNYNFVRLDNLGNLILKVNK